MKRLEKISVEKFKNYELKTGNAKMVLGGQSKVICTSSTMDYPYQDVETTVTDDDGGFISYDIQCFEWY